MMLDRRRNPTTSLVGVGRDLHTSHSFVSFLMGPAHAKKRGGARVNLVLSFFESGIDPASADETLEVVPNEIRLIAYSGDNMMNSQPTKDSSSLFFFVISLHRCAAKIRFFS